MTDPPTGRDTTSADSAVEVAVVVVTYNSARVLPGFVESLATGMVGLENRWRLVVVDNNSDDATLDIVRTCAPDSVVIRMGRNAGYAAGVNAGAAALPATRAVLVANPDVRLARGTTRAMLDSMDTQGTGIVVPQLFHTSGDRIYSLRREPSIATALGEALLGTKTAGRFGVAEAIVEETSYLRRSIADWAAGSVMLLSRACLDAVGPWDESFFLYSEETDFALRARDAGWRLMLEPTASAIHLEGESKISTSLHTLLALNRVRLYQRRHGRVATLVFRSAVFMREASRAALGRRPSRYAAIALLTPGKIDAPASS